jgi:DNA polymerase
MDTESSRLWHALGLGPVWRLRTAGGVAAPDGSGTFALPRSHAGAAGEPALAPADHRAVDELSDWTSLEAAVAACTACGLCETRTRTVFGVGQGTAHWMFVGEAPGAEEDARGEPFVGQAGRLLDNMLAAAGLGRDRQDAQGVYIANVLKCRPPGNRNPQPPEVARCAPYLRRQIALLRPRMLVLLGRFAVDALLQTDASIGSLRGRVHEVTVADGAGTLRVPAIVTYHPSYLLRNLGEKARSWEDLLLALDTYALLRPPA